MTSHDNSHLVFILLFIVAKLQLSRKMMIVNDRTYVISSVCSYEHGFLACLMIQKAKQQRRPLLVQCTAQVHVGDLSTTASVYTAAFRRFIPVQRNIFVKLLKNTMDNDTSSELVLFYTCMKKMSSIRSVGIEFESKPCSQSNIYASTSQEKTASNYWIKMQKTQMIQGHRMTSQKRYRSADFQFARMQNMSVYCPRSVTTSQSVYYVFHFCGRNLPTFRS